MTLALDLLFQCLRGRILRLQFERAAHVRGCRGLLISLQIEPAQHQVSGDVRLGLERFGGLHAGFLDITLVLSDQRQPGASVRIITLGRERRLELPFRFQNQPLVEEPHARFVECGRALLWAPA